MRLALKTLKTLLTPALILTLSMKNKEFMEFYNAWQVDLGNVLMYKGEGIKYTSRQLKV